MFTFWNLSHFLIYLWLKTKQDWAVKSNVAEHYNVVVAQDTFKQNIGENITWNIDSHQADFAADLPLTKIFHCFFPPKADATNNRKIPTLHNTEFSELKNFPTGVGFPSRDFLVNDKQAWKDHWLIKFQKIIKENCA